MDDLAVRTERLTHAFAPGVGAIDLDLRVPRGSVYGFLGPNGAGKSTAIRMLVGILRPQRGHARVLGVDPATDDVALLTRVGVLSSDAAIPRHHTGQQHVDLLAALRDLPSFRVRAAELAERLDLDLRRPAHELSLGNRQKLGLVTALAHDPELVILDEPTNGLDPLLQRELDTMLRELADAGRTVLLSSHSLDEVERVADHVGFIREALLVEQAPLGDLAARALRRATFLFPSPVPEAAFMDLPGVVEVHASANGCEVDVAWQGPVAEILGVAARHDATTIEARGVDLEATFLAMYAGAGTPEAPR